MPTFFILTHVAMYRDTLLQTITEIITPLLNIHGEELVELQLNPQKGRWLVRVFVDALCL